MAARCVPDDQEGHSLSLTVRRVQLRHLVCVRVALAALGVARAPPLVALLHLVTRLRRRGWGGGMNHSEEDPNKHPASEELARL